MSDQANRPPPLARWLLRRVLDGAARSAILGDLDEEFTGFILPRLGARAARRWYWRQTITSIAACLREPAVSDLEPAERISAGGLIMQDRHGFGADLRAAARFCWRHPLVSITVVATLAVGIGATTAVFAVLNATFLKRLPIANAERLVAISSKGGGAFSYPEYLALRNVPGLQALIAGDRSSTTLGSAGDDGWTRQRVVIEKVTGNYFEALGVGPGTRGRLFTDADASGHAAGGCPEPRRLAEALRLGPCRSQRTIRLHRGVFTIVGVTPPGFTGTQIGYGPDLWVPLTHAPLIDGHTAVLGVTSASLGLQRNPRAPRPSDDCTRRP